MLKSKAAEMTFYNDETYRLVYTYMYEGNMLADL